MNTCYYGLKWERDPVPYYWGWRGKRGGLYGKIDHTKNAIDYAYQRGIYILYDSSKIMYISSSWKEHFHSMSSRTIYDCLKKHTTHKSFNWDTFSWFAIYKDAYDDNPVGIPQASHKLLQYFEGILNILLENTNNWPGKIRQRHNHYVEFKRVEQVKQTK